MNKSLISLVITSALVMPGTVLADGNYYHGVPFHDDDNEDVSYNYRDYSSGASVKTFKVTGSAVDGSELGALIYDTEVRTYDRTIPGIVSYSRDRKVGGAGGVGVNYSVITMDKSGDELLLTKFERYSSNGLTLKETRTMTPGVVFRTENMGVGKTFGSYSSLDSSKAGLSSVIQSVTLLGVEDVTVPAGSFTGCIKLLRHRNSERLGGEYDRINWFCPNNVGLVKSVTMQTTSTVLELESITP